MNRRQALALAAAPLVGAACRTPAASRGEVVLDFWGLGREGEVVAALIPAFERANPGIRVRVQQIPWTAAHEKLLTAYAGESMPDLFQLGNTWVPEFVALDALTPLDPLLARLPDVPRADYFPGIWQTNVLGGTTWGLPWYVDTRVVFYRQDLLRRAGFDRFPTDWAAWVRAMEAVRRLGGPDTFAIYLPTNEWAQPVVLGLQEQSPLLREGGRYGDFRGEPFRRAFAFYVDLFRRRLAPPVGANQMSNLYQEFGRGYFAMYISGPWNVGEFKRRMPPEQQDDWMTAPLPGPRGPGVSLAGGASLALARSSAHPEAAARLMAYLSHPAQQLAFFRLTGNLPARKTAWQDPALAGDPYMRAFFEQLGRTVPLPQVPEWERIATEVMNFAEAAVRGQLTPDQALARLDASVDRILEKRRWLLDRAAATASR